MPVHLLATNVAQISPVHTTANEVWMNTHYIKLNSQPGIADLNALANIYLAWATATGRGHWATNTQLVKMYCRDRTVVGGATIDFVPTAPVIGNRASVSLPNNCAFCVKKDCGLSGRHRRGRLYWGGLTEDVLDSSSQFLTTGAAVGITADLNTLRNNFQAYADGAQYVVCGWHNEGTLVNPADTFETVGFTFTDQAIDSQRRRLPFHNRHH